jgi:Ca2+-binding EF-hand superfamily protein
MIASVKASFGALAWSSALLLVIQMMLALFMATLLESYFKSGEPKVNKQDVYEYYGTFTRALLTLFEISLGNFIPVTRLVATNVTEAYVVFAMLHKFSVGFAVIMVITGIFVQETMSVAKTDNTIMLNLKKSATRMHIKKMKSFFDLADADGSGCLDAEEFEEVCRDEQVKMWLAAQELDVSDAKAMFGMMCQEIDSEEVTPEQLVKGMARLKGSARNLDMMSLRQENSELRSILKELLSKVEQVEKLTSREREEDGKEEEAAMSDLCE